MVIDRPGPVVALLCSGGMTDFLLNSLLGLEKAGVPAEKVVIGCDAATENAVLQVALGRPVRVLVMAGDPADAPSTGGGYMEYASIGFNDAMWMKVRLIRELLTTHGHVVYADLDVAWLRNPLPYLEQVAQHYPMAFQTESQATFPPSVCCGFLSFLRSERSLAFIDAMMAEDHVRVAAGRRTGDQAVAQWVLDTDPSWVTDMFFLPELLFVNGLGHGLLESTDLEPDVLAGELAPYVFHANWTIGAANKRELMARTGTWVAPDDEAAEVPVRPEAAHASAGAVVTIVYPMFDARGEPDARIRLWTQEQDLPAERYRVLVVAGPDPAADLSGVRALLRPGDLLVISPAEGREADYWQVGAASCSTPWVMFVEGHAIPRADCLSHLVGWIDEHPEDAALNCAVENPDVHTVSPLMERWFGELQSAWADPSTWPRLHRAAFAIRRDVLRQVGLLQPQYGQFAPPLLSARLDEAGVVIRTIPGARVEHEDSLMDGHHADTRDYVQGELKARAEQPAAFFEGFFGASPVAGLDSLPARDVRAMSGSLARGWLSSPVAGRRCLVASLGLAPAGAVGLHHRIRLRELRTRMDEWLVMRAPLPARWRWHTFTHAHARVVRTEQLVWAAGQQDRPLVVPAGGGRWPAEELGRTAVKGMHGLEWREGTAFRWTEPVCALSLEMPRGAWEVGLATRDVRSPTALSVRDIVVDGHRLGPDRVTIDADGAIWLHLERATDGPVTAVVVARSMREPGGRRLGLPLFAVDVRPAAASVPAVRS